MNINRLFRRTTHGALWYLVLVVALPIVSLTVLGLIYLWQHDYFLMVLVAWLAFTLAGYAAFSIRPSTEAPLATGPDSGEPSNDSDLSEILPDQLEKRPDWTDADRAVWEQSLISINAVLAQKPDWESLPEHALALLSGVSAHYHPTASAPTFGSSSIPDLEYRFTLPEALLVVSVASDRYRRVVLSHIPFAERVTVSTLRKLYRQQGDIKSGFTWFNRVRRVARLVNPVAAAVGELRDQFTDRVFNHLSDSVQSDLKSLLLQEVVQVGIDLYSGKLKSSADELQRYQSRSFREDEQHQPEAIEPLRIVLLGQTSSGKSSLVNALANALQAEVDTLPTTDRTQTHVVQIDHAAPMHLIDTVGLDGSAASINALAEQAADADMLVYMARATQPARAPDQQLYAALNTVFAARPERRVPPLLLALTHVDLLPPRNEWSPPYDLGSSDRKASMINEALISSAQQIGLPANTPAVPVCLSAERGLYNVEAIAAALMSLQNSATLAQWNRRRVERGEQSISWTERWLQIKRLGQVVGQATLRKP